MSERAKEWKRDNPLKWKAIRRDSDRRNAIQRRNSRIKRRYKLAPEKITEFLGAQDYKCAICQVPFLKEGELYRFVIDHDHNTGKVRGLLCSACNTGLGQFEDDPKIIRNAFYYLRDSKNRN